MHHDTLLKIALAFSLVAALFACEPEEDPLTWKPGTNLFIIDESGATADSEVPTGVSQAFRVDGFTVDKTYSWTLNDSPVTPIDKGESVNVAFAEPGDYVLKVSNGTSEGSIAITAAAVMLSLDGNATGVSESSDTISVPIVLSTAIESAVTVNYTLGGTAVVGEDYQLLSPNPLVVSAGAGEAAVSMVLVDNMMVNDPAKTITLTINAISAAGTTAGVVLPDSVPFRTYTVTIMDDLKYVAFADPETDTLRALTSSGVYTFDVLLSAATAVDVTVPYTVVGGTGVEDLTQGEVTFLAGQTSVSLVVDIQPEAFAADQTIMLTLGTIVSGDEEVGYEMDDMDASVGSVKSVVIVAPE